MGYETHAEGTLVADGTEQTVSEISEATKFMGYVSLSNMQAGDQVIIRQYARLNGVYERYADETCNDAPPNPIIYVTPKEVTSGLRVTLQQTGGIFRQFQYKFIKEASVPYIGHRFTL